MKGNPYALAAASGILLGLSFPPLPLGFLAFVAFIPLLIGIRGRPVGIVFRSSMLGGFVFGVCLLYWVANMWVEARTRAFLVGGVGLLCVYFGLAFAFPLLGVRFARRAFGVPGLLSFPFYFAGLEFLRSLSHMGFPWGSLAYTQTAYVGLIQFASVTSVAGVSFWIASINLALYFLFFTRVNRLFKSVSFGLLLLVFALPAIEWQLTPKERERSSIRVAVVQAEVPPSLKRLGDEKKRFGILVEETRRLAGDQVGLIVWPETAAPGYFVKEPEDIRLVLELADSLGAPIVLGARDYEKLGHKNYRYFNAVFLVSPGRGVVGKYHKIQLVPFGERLPFDDVFPALRKVDLGQGHFSPGKEYKTFQIGQLRFAPLVCFESIFPRLVRRFVNNGADFLVNITDDGWYGRTSGQFQHAEMAVLRCIENRISLVRCANTGVSMFVDPYGRVTGRTKTFVRVTESASIQSRMGETFYSRHGDVFAWAVVIVGFSLIGLTVVRRRIAR
ncbi:MAG: apolipoprotein N-acyltransferase [bacterium]